ncbi:MAG: AAA family ATPase [Egibacteraceae bacterium]
MGITQVQVSRIENGRPIVHLDQLIHWARTLRIPQEDLWFKLPEKAGAHQSAALTQPEFADLGRTGQVSVTALHNALLRAMPTPVDRVTPDPDHEALEQRVLDAWAARSRAPDHRPLLAVVGGFAGCGKTEFGRFLSGVTGWTHLDKDVLTRPLVESLLASLGADPNDRHTELYLRQVRPVEYRCLLSAMFNNLDNGVSTILTAPFLQEMPNFSWLQRLGSRCAAREVDVAVIWVDADVEAMHTYLQARDAARDTWKLNHWDDYLASIDLNLRPSCPHFVIDNRQNAALDVADQAQRLAGLVHYHQ